MQGNPLEAFNAFLDKIQSLPEVYIVTQSQMLAWVRSPTPLSKVKEFQPWQCPKRPAPRCSYKAEKTCTYDLPSQQRVFQACIDTCPKCTKVRGEPSCNRKKTVLYHTMKYYVKIYIVYYAYHGNTIREEGKSPRLRKSIIFFSQSIVIQPKLRETLHQVGNSFN